MKKDQHHRRQERVERAPRPGAHGETIVIEDRGVPVARLESVAAPRGGMVDGRAARLERQGGTAAGTGRGPETTTHHGSAGAEARRHAQ
jgi:antitoxin (DNA-binding transcriptional repressor) of toxin-antitoxin stability system